MNSRLTAVLAIVLFITAGATSQEVTDTVANQADPVPGKSGPEQEMSFIQYCSGRGNYTDALILLNRMKKRTDLDEYWQDSLNYWLGWTYYSAKKLDSSSFYFQKVTARSTQYLKSRFFASYDEIFLGRAPVARSWLQSLQVPDHLRDSLGELTAELRSLQLAGIALLERDHEEFRKQSAGFSYVFYTLEKEQKNLAEYNRLLKDFRPKSQWLSGIMSALVPGSGKLYAGKTGEGIAAFLVVTSLGLVTWENFHKDGLANWKTLLAGGAFTLYYTGNILGSASAARRHNHAFTQTMDNRILFDLHIPLRNIFN